MRSTPEVCPIHPAFPTLARSSEEDVYSDHVLMAFDMPLSEAPEDRVHLLSWNILGVNAPSGLHTKDHRPLAEEKARLDRVLEAIARAAHQNDIGIILLQEAHVFPYSRCEESELKNYSLPEKWVEFLNKETGKKWEARVCDAAGVITFCDTEKYNILDQNVSVREDPVRRLSLTLEEKNNQKRKFKVHNLHGNYTPFNHVFEEYITGILDADINNLDIKASGMGGDINSRIAPIDYASRNITTNIMPVNFFQKYNESPIQYAEFADGFFYKTSDKTGIHQSAGNPIDVKTGTQYDLGSLSVTQHENSNILSPVMCITEKQLNAEFLGENNVFEYEKKLKKLFGSDEIKMVREGCNSNNERGVFIVFKYNPEKTWAHDCLEKFLKKGEVAYDVNRHFHEEKSAQGPCQAIRIKISKEQEEKVKVAIEQAASYFNMPEELKYIIDVLEQRIFEIKQEKSNTICFFHADGALKITALNSLINNIIEEKQSSSLHQIFEKWCGEKPNQKGEKTNLMIVQEHRGLFGWLMQLFGFKTKTEELLEKLRAEADDPSTKKAQKSCP